MEKGAYVEAARRLQADAQLEDGRDRRWDWIPLLNDHLARRRVQRHRQMLEALRNLPVPTEDASQLEGHFLSVLEGEIDNEEGAAKAGRFRLIGQRPRFAPKLVETDWSGLAFRIAYGLEDPVPWDVHATFAERAAAISLSVEGTSTHLVPLDDVALQALIGSKRGVRLAEAFALGDHPVHGAGIVTQTNTPSGSWAVHVVAQPSPDAPMAMVLAAAPPKHWRDQASLMTLHGSVCPGKVVVAELPDGTFLAPATVAHLVPWPPIPTKRLGRIPLGFVQSRDLNEAYGDGV